MLWELNKTTQQHQYNKLDRHTGLSEVGPRLVTSILRNRENNPKIAKKLTRLSHRPLFSLKMAICPKKLRYTVQDI